MGINKVFLSGNIGSDPELRCTQSGMQILRFSLAVNDRKRDQQTGEWTDYTNWVTCLLFGKRAEAVSRLVGKGSKVSVEGKLHYSTWENNGQKRSAIDVNVDEIELMVQRSQSQQNGYQNNYQNSQSNGYQNNYQNGHGNAYQQQQQPSMYSDDIPF